MKSFYTKFQVNILKHITEKPDRQSLVFHPVELLQEVELLQDVELVQDVEHLQDVELLQDVCRAFLNACFGRFKVGLKDFSLVFTIQL